MANPDSTQSTEASAYKEDPVDTLNRKASQLYSMLMTTYGAGAESFHAYNEDIKDSFLWACADLASEIKDLSSRVIYNGIKEA